MAHLHTGCPASSEAISIITNCSADKAAPSVLRSATVDDFCFRSSTPMSEADRITILLFSAAVWKARSSLAHRPFQAEFQARAAHQIAIFFLADRKTTQKKRSSKRNRTRERQEFLALLATLPLDTMSVYTDGSSYGNPGPAGSGFVVFHHDDTPNDYHSCDIGEATNNVAELQAILKSLRLLLARPPRSQLIHFFVDNQYGINVTLGKWKAKSNKKLVLSIQNALSLLRELATMNFFWVPGHARVFGNEVTTHYPCTANFSTLVTILDY